MRKYNNYLFQRTELLIHLGSSWSNLSEFLIRIEEQHLSSHPSLQESHLDQVYSSLIPSILVGVTLGSGILIPPLIHTSRSHTWIRFTYPFSNPYQSESHLDLVYSSLIPSILAGVTLGSGIIIFHPIHPSRSHTWNRYTHPSSHLSQSESTQIKYTHPSSHSSLQESHLDQVYSSLISSILEGVTLGSGISSLIPSILVGVKPGSGILIPHPIHPSRSHTWIRYTYPSSHPSLQELHLDQVSYPSCHPSQSESHLDQVYSPLIPSILVGVTLGSGILFPHPIHPSRSHTRIRYLI